MNNNHNPLIADKLGEIAAHTRKMLRGLVDSGMGGDLAPPFNALEQVGKASNRGLSRFL